MKTRISVLFAAFLLFATAIGAQETIKFDKTIHDFGNIAEKGGPVTYSFEFTNTGTQPLVIQNVSASCGCTTPGWSQAPVPPGGRGFVKATYEPTAAVSFDKSLTVTSTGTPNNVVLRIRGKALTKMPTVEESYPVAHGALRLYSDVLPMARIIQGAAKKDSIEIINTGKENLALTFSNVPAPLKVVAVPATLKPGEKGSIRVTYDTKQKKEWGTISYPVAIRANGKAIPNAQLTVTATIVDDFSAADYQTAPVAKVQRSAVSFDVLKKGDSYTAAYEITNTGKSALTIHKAESENAGIKISAPAAIKPGETAKVSVTLNTKNETPGDKLYAITLVTNAPNQSLISLLLTGKIN